VTANNWPASSVWRMALPEGATCLSRPHRVLWRVLLIGLAMCSAISVIEIAHSSTSEAQSIGTW
jgi:hypothetical protein